MPWFILFLLLLAMMEAFPRVSTCARNTNIYWNSTNPIFRIDNTDHIIDVNKQAFEYDRVNIICPVYQSETYDDDTEKYDDDTEKYIIYNVSKEEYETCRITNPSPRVIAVCDQPRRMMHFPITFRPFTPQPGGLEFLPGHDYYFISTSSKDDLHRRIGGRCTSHNMKVVFKVCCADAETSPSSATSRNNSVAVTTSTVPSSSSTSTAILGGGAAAKRLQGRRSILPEGQHSSSSRSSSAGHGGADPASRTPGGRLPRASASAAAADSQWTAVPYAAQDLDRQEE